MMSFLCLRYTGRTQRYKYLARILSIAMRRLAGCGWTGEEPAAGAAGVVAGGTTSGDGNSLKWWLRLLPAHRSGALAHNAIALQHLWPHWRVPGRQACLLRRWPA